MLSQPSRDRLVQGALILGGMFIFALDMTPVRGAADGAAYGLVIALAATFGRQPVIVSAWLGAALTVIGPFLGAEAGETLLQIITGRLFGLAVIGLLTAVLLRLLGKSADIAASAAKAAVYQTALDSITKLALAASKPLEERLQVITEEAAAVLHADRVSIGRMEGDERFRLYDIWDRRLGVHSASFDTPACLTEDYLRLVSLDGVLAQTDVHDSPVHRESLAYFDKLGIKALLHVAAAYRDEVLASLIISTERRHVWSEHEISFAKTASQIVALIFAMQDSKRTVQRLDGVSQGIFVLGESGAVVYANLAARHLAGSGERMPSVPFALPPLQGVGDDHQIRFAGREFELNRSRLPAEEIMLRIDDVTVRNAAMAEALNMQAQLKESAKLQAMGQMAAGVAHDFNNILAAIAGYAQGLQRKLDAMPLERNFVDRILGVCKKGQAMTREILGVARTNATQRDEIDLAELIGADIADLQGVSEGHTHLTVLPPSERLPVYGNAAQLSQLVQNLVVNATHACEGGNGQITVSAGRASHEDLHRVASAAHTAQERMLGVIMESRAYCYLRVADNGHGIPAAVFDHIFEPFFTTKGSSKGSGLGLVVVHGVVDSHHGSCHVLTRPGEGTVFTIYLPLLEEAETVAA